MAAEPPLTRPTVAQPSLQPLELGDGELETMVLELNESIHDLFIAHAHLMTPVPPGARVVPSNAAEEP